MNGVLSRLLSVNGERRRPSPVFSGDATPLSSELSSVLSRGSFAPGVETVVFAIMACYHVSSCIEKGDVPAIACLMDSAALSAASIR